MKRSAEHDAKELQRMKNRAMQFNCPVIIPFLKWDLIERDGLICYLCEKPLTYRKATIDHIIPLSRGGWHCLSNAKLACMPCNVKKDNRTLEEYF